jgi:16S rRNA (guanine527-N7)-methyltransferase
MAGDQRQQLADTLVRAANALELAISPSQTVGLIDFVNLLARWNSTYNLTALRELPEMLVRHVIDCLAAVRPLRRELAARPGNRLLDVGSGAGLPGVVFAMLEPAWNVTCVDSVGKKAAFLQHAAATLELQNLKAVHSRVEALPPGATYDIVMARAFASLADFTRLTSGVLADAGLWMAMKGKTPRQEMEALPRTVQVFHVEPLSVPGLDESRCVIWMRSNSHHSKSKYTHLTSRAAL